MNSDSRTTETAKPTNAIGIVTDSRVIIYKGKNSNVIPLGDIKSINLIKKRIFYGNAIFLIIAMVISYLLILFKELDVIVKLTSSLLILVTGLLAFVHKFYLYQVTIGLKDEKSLILNASQFRKEQIKNFHYLIRKKLRKNNLDR